MTTSRFGLLRGVKTVIWCVGGSTDAVWYKPHRQTRLSNRVSTRAYRCILDEYYLSAFKATGIVPLNAEPVLSKLNVQIRTPTPVSRPSSRSSVYCPETPANIRQLIKHEASTKRVLRFQSATPPRQEKDQVKQVYKACEVFIKEYILLHEEVQRLRAENYKKTKKRHYQSDK